MRGSRNTDLLKRQSFRQAREQDWQKLSQLMDKAESGSASRLTVSEILSVPVLYRSALSSLSVARETSLDQSLIEYLEMLCARAYFFVYGSRASMPERIKAFFIQAWPQAVRALWRETVASAVCLIAGAFVAYWLVSQNPEWFYAFVPQGLAGDRGPDASAETLRASLEGTDGAGGLSAFAAYLFTNNSRVALMAFAFGFALCLPTILLIFYNGATLGAFVHLFVSKGLGVELGGWLLIHGVTELFAVILAGAAGIRIGWAVAFPGQLTRMEAAQQAGRTAGVVMIGVIIMLLLAGVLEGFGRQLIVDTGARYAVAAMTAVIWALYFYFGKREARNVG